MNKIINKYKNMSPAVKSSIWYAICSVLQKGLMLLCTPIFTRMLSPEEYSEYTIYQSWYNIIIVFATLNLFYGAFNNGIMKFPDKRKQYISSMQSLTSVLTFLIVVIYIVFRNQLNGIINLSLPYMIAIFIETLFAPAYSFWAANERYDYNYKMFTGISITSSLISPVLAIILINILPEKSVGLVLGFVGVKTIIGLVFYIYNYIKGKSFFVKSYWKFALKMNLPLLPHYLAMTFLNQMDRIMINNMIGGREAAIYSVAYSIAMMMNIITTAINNSYVPFTYKAIKNEEYKKLKETANALLILIAVLCVVAMTLGPEIISIFADKEYSEAVWVIPPVATSVFFMFLYPLFGNIEFYYEKTKFTMVVSCISAGLNIALNFLFIKWFGYLAAGYTTLLCYVIAAIGHFLFYKSLIKKRIPSVNELYDIKKITIISILILIIMFIITLTYQATILRYSMTILIIIAFAINRNKILNALKKIKKKEV